MTIQNTKQWFEAAVPEPTERSRAVQLGCHLEEVAEMLQAMTGCPYFRKDRDAAIDALTFLADGLKCGIYSVATTSAKLGRASRRGSGDGPRWGRTPPASDAAAAAPARRPRRAW